MGMNLEGVGFPLLTGRSYKLKALGLKTEQGLWDSGSIILRGGRKEMDFASDQPHTNSQQAFPLPLPLPCPLHKL